MKNSSRATIVLLKRNRKLVRGGLLQCMLGAKKRSLARSMPPRRRVFFFSLSLPPTQTQTQSHPFPLSKTTSNKSNLPFPPFYSSISSSSPPPVPLAFAFFLLSAAASLRSFPFFLASSTAESNAPGVKGEEASPRRRAWMREMWLCRRS